MKTEKLNKMTPQEAIKELSYDNTAYGGKCTKEVRETAIKALEKQIPKKVNNREEHADYIEGNCPDCDLPVCDVDNFCSKCGCLLDWSE